MKYKKCIFFFGITRFDAPVESTSYTLAKELAKNNNLVFYIEYPYTFADKIKQGKTSELSLRKKALLAGSSSRSGNGSACSPCDCSTGWRGDCVYPNLAGSWPSGAGRRSEFSCRDRAICSKEGTRARRCPSAHAGPFRL